MTNEDAIGHEVCIGLLDEDFEPEFMHLHPQLTFGFYVSEDVFVTVRQYDNPLDIRQETKHTRCFVPVN